MVNSGFVRPQDRIVINLAPAELPKQAASFDLPIILGILAGSGQIASDLFERYAVVGELSLEGKTRPTKGALSMAISAAHNVACTASSCRPPVRRKRPSSSIWRSLRSTAWREAVGFFSGELTIDPTPRDWTICSTSIRDTTRISRMCAARRWPSGR